MATLRQQAAFNELVGNGGSIAKAMKKVMYSGNTANTPKKLTQSKGFQELLATQLPDELLAKVHLEGLKATTFYSEGIGRGETQLIEKTDFSVRHRYLESAYKIKGKLKEVETPQTIPHQTLIIINPPANK